MKQYYFVLKNVHSSKYALSVSVCVRTLVENSVELRLSVQAKEMGRIQTAINAQV